MVIIKVRSSLLATVVTVAATLLGGPGSAAASDLPLYKVPQHSPFVAAQPELLPIARAEFSNASSASTLFDPAAGCDLPAGISTVVISLSQIENVDSIALAVREGSGTVAIATASAKLNGIKRQWHDEGAQPIASGEISRKIGPADAKYVRLTFNLAAPGHVSALSLSGTANSGHTAGRAGAFGFVSVARNFGSPAHALYVSSGLDLDRADNMIDARAETDFAFAAGDPAPTAVIDLGKSMSIRGVTAQASPRRGSLRVFVLKNLPGLSPKTSSADAPEALLLKEGALPKAKAAAAMENDGSRDRASADFAPQTGRYVMLQWTPSSPQDGGFTIAEIAFRGADPVLQPVDENDQTEMASNQSNRRMTRDPSDGKDVIDAKDVIESKDVPAEGPEPPGEGPPPNLPQPPPFTFIPQVLPTSP